MTASPKEKNSESTPLPVQTAFPVEVFENRLRWARIGVLVLLAITVATAYLTRHCLAVANTRMQAELNFNNEQFGYLYSAFSLGYLICQVPGGWLGQSLGTRVTLPLLCGLWSLMTLATGVVTSLPALVMARFGYGVAQAGLVPNQAQVIKDWFLETSRGQASAVIVTAMSVGGFGALWLTSQLLQFQDWRTLLISYSIFGVGWSALLYFLFRSRPDQVVWLHSNSSSEQTHTLVEKRSSHSENQFSLVRSLWSLSIWALFTQMMFKAAGYNLLVTFFPTYLELAHQIPAESAGGLTSWSLIAVVLGSLSGGWLIDQLQWRTGSKRISRVGVACISLLLTAALMLVAPYAGSGEKVAVIIAISSFLMGIAGPCAWAASIDVGDGDTAVVMGFLNMGGALAGIVLSPWVGRLIDQIKQTGGNWNLVIHVHALFYIIAAMSWLLITFKQTPNLVETPDAV